MRGRKRQEKKTLKRLINSVFQVDNLIINRKFPHWYYVEIKENKTTTCTWLNMRDIPLHAKRFYSQRMQIVLLTDNPKEYFRIHKWYKKEIERINNDNQRSTINKIS